jgi:hypothetical protein
MFSRSELSRENNINHTWDEAGLKQPEENSQRNKSMVSLDETLTKSHESSAETHSSQPVGGTDLLEDQITWDLKKDIRRNLDQQRDVEIISHHPQILLKPLESCVSQINSVDESPEEDDANWQENSDVEFANELLLGRGVNQALRLFSSHGTIVGFDYFIHRMPNVLEYVSFLIG